jgi:hypothetical protein
MIMSVGFKPISVLYGINMLNGLKITIFFLSNKRVVIRNISIAIISDLRCLFDTLSTGVCDPDGTPLTEKSSTQVVEVQVVEL